MCLPFGVLFREIWYSDGGGFHQRRRSLIIGLTIVKSTQFGQNWVLFFRKWYTNGWKIGQKIGIEKVKIFVVRQAHTPTILVRVPPTQGESF